MQLSNVQAVDVNSPLEHPPTDTVVTGHPVPPQDTQPPVPKEGEPAQGRCLKCGHYGQLHISKVSSCTCAYPS